MLHHISTHTSLRSKNHQGEVGRSQKPTMDHEETREESNIEMHGRLQSIQRDTKEMKHHLGTIGARIKMKEAMKMLDHVFTFQLDGWMHVLGII